MSDSSKYILIPILAIIPCFVYTLLYSIGVDQLYALTSAFILTAICDQVNRHVFKNSLYNIIFALFSVNLAITFIVWLLTYKVINSPNFCFIVFEIITLIFFLTVRANRRLIYLRVRKYTPSQKMLYQGFIEAGTLISYCFFMHLSSILIYLYLRQAGVISLINLWDIIIFRLIPITILVLVVAYEIWRSNYLIKKLKKEEWLPIVNEQGDITGKIAKSVSLKQGDKFCHPVVRVALICGEKVFLQERSQSDFLFPGKLDYPFEKYTLYGHNMRDSVTNIIRKKLHQPNITMGIDYIFKYPYENSKTKRLIFFYTARISNEADIKRTEMMGGKFWTIKQIEEAFADECFSENFEFEFEYLKNMILLKDENCIFDTKPGFA